MKNNKIANRVSDSLEISRDIVITMPRIVITGNGVITIEGFQGLIEYTEKKTVVKTKRGAVIIEGMDLSVDEITEEVISLKGEIFAIRLV